MRSPSQPGPAPAALAEVGRRSSLRDALQALDAAAATPQPFTMSEALAEVGRSYALLQALPSAICNLEQSLRWAWLTGSNDLAADRLCELCELRVRHADELACSDDAGPEAGVAAQRQAARAAARDDAFAAAAIASRVADPQWAIKLLLRVSDALDRCGDHGDAAAFQCRALELMSREPAADADPAPVPTSLL
jgi:hypothetical protein